MIILKKIKTSKFDVYIFPMLGIDSRMYLIFEGNSALVIDPNINIEAVEMIEEKNIQNVICLLTHEHFDHISGVNYFRTRFSEVKIICSEVASNLIINENKNLAKYWDVLMMGKSEEDVKNSIHLKDEYYRCSADQTFNETQIYSWEGHWIKAVLAPGHSKGSAIYFLDDLLFTGDSLVNGVGVICRLPGGSWKIYEKNTKVILDNVSDDIYVLPGHGEPAKMRDLRKYIKRY